ncbi:MAG: redoxin family protein [Pirellulaceae bacterium]|nr:redoxin family protein [Pirellulaceae bacterium]
MAMRSVFLRFSQLYLAKPILSGVLGSAALSGTLSNLTAADVDSRLVAQGLAKPAKQTDSDYTTIDAGDAAGKYENRNEIRGLLIYNKSNNETLRWLADSNGDGKVDQLSFFKDGVEVYRDIDSDFDEKIDQSRWMGTAGMRWGIDKDQDGTLDYWKMISAEEVTSEIVHAVRDNDPTRFQRLLMTKAELNALGLGQVKTAELSDRLDAALEEFRKLAASQKAIDKSSKWASFGADKPGWVPAGTEDSTADVLAYENVMAVVDTSNGPQQMLIGTLVKVNENWRMLDVPKLVSDGTAVTENGLFFAASTRDRSRISNGSGSAISGAMEKLIKDMEVVESKLQDPKGDKSKLHSQRADILEQLIAASTTKDDAQAWARQLADQVLSAVQSGEYPEGIARLRRVQSNVLATEAKSEVSYVAYRILNAEYNVAIGDKDANFELIQKKHLEGLESFVDKFPSSPDSADAMIQLGLNSELTNEIKDAEKWYELAAKNFPGTSQGEKAQGALLRLSLVGREIAFAGNTLNGKNFTTAKLGKPVLVHYWASWCVPCKADMQEIKKLQAKYAKKGLTIVGVNADNDAAEAVKYLKENQGIDWVQLHEKGGLESRIAVGLGVLSLPVTILIDKNGKVARSTSHYTPNLETDIAGMLK